MSAYLNDAIVRHGVAGGTAFIEKPFYPLDALIRRVREELDSRESPPASNDQ